MKTKEEIEKLEKRIEDVETKYEELGYDDSSDFDIREELEKEVYEIESKLQVLFDFDDGNDGKFKKLEKKIEQIKYDQDFPNADDDWSDIMYPNGDDENPN